MPDILNPDFAPKKTDHNVKMMVDEEAWDFIRRRTYKKAAYRCEICSGKGEKWPVECHEKWRYDDKKKIMTLERFIALCPLCHMVYHYMTRKERKKKEMIDHIIKVNCYQNAVAAYQLISDASFVYNERSRYTWEIDITYLLELLAIEGLKEEIEFKESLIPDVDDPEDLMVDTNTRKRKLRRI